MPPIPANAASIPMMTGIQFFNFPSSPSVIPGSPFDAPLEAWDDTSVLSVSLLPSNPDEEELTALEEPALPAELLLNELLLIELLPAELPLPVELLLLAELLTPVLSSGFGISYVEDDEEVPDSEEEPDEDVLPVLSDDAAAAPPCNSEDEPMPSEFPVLFLSVLSPELELFSFPGEPAIPELFPVIAPFALPEFSSFSVFLFVLAVLVSCFPFIAAIIALPRTLPASFAFSSFVFGLLAAPGVGIGVVLL